MVPLTLQHQVGAVDLSKDMLCIALDVELITVRRPDKVGAPFNQH